MRLTFIQTGNVNAKLLVLGGSIEALTQLFDTPHPQAAEREARRVAFNELFSRDLQHPRRKLTHAVWSVPFSEAGDRIPEATFRGFNGRLKTELVACADSRVRDQIVGRVLVWQCNRTRGTA